MIKQIKNKSTAFILIVIILIFTMSTNIYAEEPINEPSGIPIQSELQPSENREDIPSLLVAGQWIQSGTKWWYRFDNGTFPANTWYFIDGCWYYFDASGWMVTGWIKLANLWYYLDSSGKLISGTFSLNGTTYITNSDGSLNKTQLGVTRQLQQKSNWCWAATCAMIGGYRISNGATQTQIVTAAYGSPVNEGGSQREILGGLEFASRGTKISSAVSVLYIGQVIEQIDKDHPFYMSLEWNSGGGHGVVGAGYDIKSASVYIIDPAANVYPNYYNVALIVRGNQQIGSGIGRYRGSYIYY